jgi:hypothetical protein
MPQYSNRRVADGQVLPEPEDGDRTRLARNGLDLPGPGELRLSGVGAPLLKPDRGFPTLARNQGHSLQC